MLTDNIVYVIHCTKCAKLYISETGRTLDTRFKEHLADIKQHRDKPVANLFNQAGHSIHNIRIKGLWLLFTDNASDKKYMESHLIDKLGSRRPGGINEKLFFLFFCFTVLSFFYFFYFTLETLFTNSLDLV